MARVVLVQYWMMDHLGLMTISSFLKKNGHMSTILVRHEEKHFIQRIIALSPDVVGFSCTTGIHLFALKDALIVKKALRNVVIVMGGPHPTFVPEIIKEEGVDVVCRGEGEVAMEELCHRIDRHNDFSDVKNLWVKRDNEIFRNKLRYLTEDLNYFPFADREHYNYYKIISSMPRRFVSTGRGCAHNCAFCYSGSLRTLYKGKGTYLRRRSINNILDEMQQIRKNYFAGYFSFEDDTFLENEEWAKEFLSAYNRYINFPFICETRFDTLNEKIVLLLKKSGCFLVSLGIESGNENMREGMLNKRLKTEKISHGAELLRKNKLRFRTYNILGIPGETVEQALDTLSLNIKIKPDFPQASLYQPYPATQLAARFISQGILKRNYYNNPLSFWSRSVIPQKNIRELENLQKLFYIYTKNPFLCIFAKQIIKIQLLRFFFELIYKITYLYFTSKAYRLSLFSVINYGFRMRRLY